MGARTRRRGVVAQVLALCACLLTLAAGCTPGATPGVSTPESAASGTTPPAATSASRTSPPSGPAGTTTVEVDGRSVQLHVPAARSAARALVVVLHGYSGDAAGAVEYFGLRRLADQRGVVIAAPQGTADGEGKNFWNASNACCNFDGSTVDDSAFLSHVIATVVAAQGIDPARVYVVGHSNGGFMAHALACQHADQVAAIASLAGALDDDADCAPTRPVSVVQIHGRADDTIRYDGGSINGDRYTSAAETVAVWRRADGCAPEEKAGRRFDADGSVAGRELTPTTWSRCSDGAEVALWSMADAGHVPALTPDFGTALLDWFEAHGRDR